MKTKTLPKIAASIAALLTAAQAALALPNLTPYQPSGWSDKIVVARTTGTTTDSTGLTTADILYVSWAVVNNGNAAAGAFYVYLYVDGAYRTYWTVSSLNANTYAPANNYSIGSLSAGTHTIMITADATGAITESNESDNSYTKTITVSNPSLPNLVPYQPAGWSDKIVVSRTTGTTTDSTSLTTADTLYVDWAVGNIGTAATGSGFYNTLYVDGVVKTAPYYGASLAAGGNAATFDYSIGSLSAETHTIMIIVDSGFQIAESNESDNSYTKTITVSSPSLPNLTPYQPSGWSDKIVVSRTTGTTTDSTSLTTADTLYVDWAVINNGNATASGVYVYLYVDGVYKTYWYTASLGVNNYMPPTDYSIGSLSAGTHTITITADPGGSIAESNEGDNSYTKTITVSSPSLPNLTPYQPSGWSDKIVVSRTTGTTTDSTSLTTADTLYVDWAVINNGNATASGVYVYLYVDGVYKTYWYTASLGVNNYMPPTDYSIGSLSAGIHTITITADPGGSIAESNESDNSYTKTITVTTPSLPNLTPYQPSGWSDKIVVSRTTGTTTDNTGLTTADTLYVDWAVGNIGTAATGSGFYNTLYVDGVVKTAPYYGASLPAGVNAATYDYPIGSLSAGTHTITIMVDSGFQIAESNESDNSYTKSISVATAGTSAPTITTAPQGQTVRTGANVTFTVVASGTSPINYQWRLNGQNISSATSSTFTLNSVTAANSGGYSVLVWNAYGSVTSATASLAVLTDGANGNTPVQISVPAAPPQPTGVDSLVVVTHGFIFITDPPVMPSWVTILTNDIQIGSPANWSVMAIDWSKYAWGINPEDALSIGNIKGLLYGQQLSQQHWKHVHLIAHSAGAALIQGIADQLKSSPNPPTIQMTFLDPFVGALHEWRNAYGDDANWADCYFTQELGLSPADLFTGSFGWTGGDLGYAYNVDVDWTDPHSQPIVYGSTLVAFSTHEWSHDFYIETVVNTDSGWCGADYGFRLSAEGGGASEQANHPIGNGGNPTVLCGPPGAIPTPNLPLPVMQISIPNIPYALSDVGASLVGDAGFVLNSIWSALPLVKSGGVHPLDETNFTDTPAWLAVGVTVTNAVNFVQFDAGFTDTNAAQGLLTVYWNTNQVGMVDERVASPGSQTYRFALPGTVTSGLYTLSFRLDSFDNSASIAVTNVATGFVGVTQPIMLGISRTNGAPVVQLTAATNFTYLIQSSTNLVDWTPTALLLNTNGTAQFIDFAATNSRARFYRAMMP
jgi:subtilase family serine protease